jgi:hypothetical protein
MKKSNLLYGIFLMSFVLSISGCVRDRSEDFRAGGTVRVSQKWARNIVDFWSAYKRGTAINSVAIFNQFFRFSGYFCGDLI